jgi:hypothetical protein
MPADRAVVERADLTSQDEDTRLWARSLTRDHEARRSLFTGEGSARSVRASPSDLLADFLLSEIRQSSAE